MSVYYRPVGAAPPWVLELMEVIGLEQVITVLKARSTTASGLSDTTNATALTAMANTVQSSAGFTTEHAASARLSFLVLRPSIHATDP